ncbi:Bax inhibitor-1/YccA family protein [Cellulomonas sp.]|uniref:Bax inhibitor-1/YccA family protein n=1 Tax=Cellulomonas sp. TaxID=40001 RepID=UPI00258E9168|nr:Bax inhibitor-1/YccA family protein [Cellulomonas sp.]MCR6687979.1 Bax inhibitor-1/YccA family protein [Cellulomonas sp.]
MANPVFSNSPVFGERTRGGGTLAAPSTIDAASLDRMYGAPAATTRETGRMTYDDVIMKTGGLLALLVVVAAGSWALVGTLPWLWIAGGIVGLVLGLVNAFKREPSPVLITLYTVAQGVFLGGISAFYEAAWNGVVGQAVLATVAVFATSLFLFRSGRVRVTPKFTRWLLVAMVGYLVFSLLNFVLAMFSVGDGAFGPLRSGWLGVVVGLVAVGLAAASLIVDFDAIKRGVEGGAPRKMAWAAAFGLMVTLIWLYLELLRLLAIIRGD